MSSKYNITLPKYKNGMFSMRASVEELNSDIVPSKYLVG